MMSIKKVQKSAKKLLTILKMFDRLIIRDMNKTYLES